MPCNGMKSLTCDAAASLVVVVIQPSRALGRQLLGGYQRVGARRSGAGVDLLERLADPPYRTLHPLRVEAMELIGDRDQAAGVGDEVRRPHDAPLAQGVRSGIGHELVVGRARNDRDL